MASPLIAFYAWTAWGLVSNVASARSLGIVILTLNLIFATLVIVLLIARRTPIGKLPGIAPRLTAFIGTFAMLLFFHIPEERLPMSTLLATGVLIIIGLAGAIISFAHLGRQFSIMPEARKLVQSGPYAVVRHPVYLFEQIAILGIALQHQQPAALILFCAHLTLQICRTVYEERVLLMTFPEYAAYRDKTPRLIPWRLRPGHRPVRDEPLAASRTDD